MGGTKNAITRVDVVVKREWYSEDELEAIMTEHFVPGEKFTQHQIEAGEQTGYEHYQIRGTLKKKRRINENNFMPLVMKGYFMPTVTENIGNFDYVTKDNTRIAGPFILGQKQLTKQMEEFMTYDMRPYQKEILNWANVWDGRSIDLIYDRVGNVGKSIFSEYLGFIDAAEEIPPFREMEKIMGWITCRIKAQGAKKMYIFDMPRGMKKDKLADFYAGIETIKNGFAYDWRHEAKVERFSRPRVVIFTNCLPVFELLSTDRWKVHEMKNDYSLVERPLDHDYDTVEPKPKCKLGQQTAVAPSG